MAEKKYIKGFVESVNSDIVSAIATTETLDRQGESVKMSGWNLENFMKNPVMLWSHRADEPAIGKVTKIYREGGAIKFDAKFAEGDSFAERLKNLVTQGILNSFSVGFMSFDSDEKGNSTQQELLEISLVNVPANPDARLASAYKSLSKDFPTRVKEGDVEGVKVKTPTCRMDAESKDECVSRKVPELMDEGMEQDQAVAVANSVCSKMCSENVERDVEPKSAELCETDRNLIRVLIDTSKQLIEKSNNLLNPAEKPKGVKADLNKVSKASSKLRTLKNVDKLIESLIKEEKN